MFALLLTTSRLAGGMSTLPARMETLLGTGHDSSEPLDLGSGQITKQALYFRFQFSLITRTLPMTSCGRELKFNS
jgi:hypothetical protein